MQAVIANRASQCGDAHASKFSSAKLIGVEKPPTPLSPLAACRHPGQLFRPISVAAFG
jgi:hypothetical protein